MILTLTSYSLCIPVIDDPAEVRTGFGITTVELFYDLLGLAQKLLLNSLRAQQVIGGNACLARIDKLPPQQPTHCNVVIYCVVHVHGTVVKNNDYCS